MPCPSATFTVWVSAWLAGAAAPAAVLDARGPGARAPDVQAAAEAPAGVSGLPAPGARGTSVAFLLAALRRAAPGPARLVLPAPGDVRGLPGPGLFSREATTAGQGVLFARPVPAEEIVGIVARGSLLPS